MQTSRIDNLAIRKRIYNVLPAATFQMHKLLQLVEIEYSEQTETARIELRKYPRMQLNRDFVTQRCGTDEFLFMLVMHELYHVLLGHTRLHSKCTQLDNIAFDAIINATLCRRFPDPLYTRFFCSLYSWESFPSCLLRPPAGWRSDHMGTLSLDPHPPDVQKAISMLYGCGTATYGDVYSLFENLSVTNLSVPLLGNHAQAEDDDMSIGFKKELIAISMNWPECEERTAAGKSFTQLDFTLPVAARENRIVSRKLRALFRRIGINRTGASSPVKKVTDSLIGTQTVLPSMRDRRSAAFEQIYGHPPIFQHDTLVTRRRRDEWRHRPHVYLDISGSFEQYLPVIVTSLLKPLRDRVCRVFAFSDVVDEVRPSSLSRYKCKNTHGTSITAVFEHILGLPPTQRPKRVAIITDGIVETVDNQILSKLNELKIELHVALSGHRYKSNVSSWAKSITVL